MAIVFVYLCGIPFAEAVGADTFIAQVFADDGKLLLDRPFRNRKNQVAALDAVAQTVVLDVLLDNQRDGEDAAFACLLFHDLQTVAVPVKHNVAGAEAQNVADAQAQVPFQHKGGSDALIGAEAHASFLHGCYDFLVLLCSQGGCLLVHGSLQKRKVRKIGAESSSVCGGCRKAAE